MQTIKVPRSENPTSPLKVVTFQSYTPSERLTVHSFVTFTANGDTPDIIIVYSTDLPHAFAPGSGVHDKCTVPLPKGKSFSVYEIIQMNFHLVFATPDSHQLEYSK